MIAATAVFGGLVVKPELIKKILRSELMKESAMYQEILQEGRQEGRQQGRQEGEQLGLQKGLQQAKLEMARKLFQKGMNLEEIINLTGLSEQLLQQELSQS